LIDPALPFGGYKQSAIIELGGVAVPVNLGLTAEGLAAQINKVGAKGLVVSSEVWSDKLDSVRGGLGSVEAVFVIGGEAPQGTRAFSELSSPGTKPVEHEAVDGWDLCAISFTSGTTGVPKGTMAMHINALIRYSNAVRDRGQIYRLT
jgi:acyl-coenzyme A synthetase/AMP-(fatty) acid ligase